MIIANNVAVHKGSYLWGKNAIIIDRAHGSLNVRIKCYYKCRDRYMDTENCTQQDMC